LRLMADKGWQREFDDPIPLPGGRKLVTLRDAAEYITALPKVEHDAADWQVAMETLILFAERDGPEMLARIGMMRALNRLSVEATPAPRRKPASVSDRSVKHATRAAGTCPQVIGPNSQVIAQCKKLFCSGLILLCPAKRKKTQS
jgi:hypothetical protein